ncbi:MAG: transketolase [Actinobacteria bacterium]|nr:MAG: transketolase [Actinomycetota bacterium]
MLKTTLKNKLQQKANLIRQDVIKMTGEAGSGHPGGSLSAADIITVLYFHHMNHKPKDPKWEGRDRFVLSKGHACPALYAALAECGYFDRKELINLRKMGSILQGHPDSRRTPGVEISTGSLGLGLPAAAGMALAGKIDKASHKVYTLIGDGESQEGIVWEGAMFAAHHKLDNMVAFLDNNGLQIDGLVNEIVKIEPIAEKWQAFGWETFEIDGHDIDDIVRSLEKADAVKGKPAMIIAKTIKGKGVSFMENEVDWHGVAPNLKQVRQALKELENNN